jgi:hypothetical protein
VARTISSVNEFAIEEKEPALYREDTLTIMGALADILVEVRLISAGLFGEEDEEEEDDA